MRGLRKRNERLEQSHKNKFIFDKQRQKDPNQLSGLETGNSQRLLANNKENTKTGT